MPFVMILISVLVRYPLSSRSKMRNTSMTSSQRFCLFTFQSIQSRNSWKSMVPLPSSSISFSLLSTSSSLTLSPSPRSRNLSVLPVMLPELLRSYILKISLSSSICSTLQELNFSLSWRSLSVPMPLDLKVDLREYCFCMLTLSKLMIFQCANSIQMSRLALNCRAINHQQKVKFWRQVYMLTFYHLKYNRLILEMSSLKLASLLLLLAAASSFVRNCQNFNPNNFDQCQQCLPGFYLLKTSCSPCPTTTNTIKECSLNQTSPKTVNSAASTPPPSTQDNSTKSKASSDNLPQVNKQMNSTGNAGVVTLDVKNSSSSATQTNNSIQTTANKQTASSASTAFVSSNASNSNVTSTPQSIIPTSTPASTPSPPLNLTQMIFNYLPPHCCEFKVVPVLVCSACQLNYILTSNNSCQMAAPSIQSTPTIDQSDKNQTISKIPITLQVSSSLPNLDKSQPIEAFIPIATPPPAHDISFFIPIVSQTAVSTQNNSSLVSNQTLPKSKTSVAAQATPSPSIVMPRKDEVKDPNCPVKNPQFSTNKPVSVDNQRCSTCYKGFYYDLSYEKCQPYNPLCKTVDSQNICLSCYMGYVLFNGNCTVNNGQMPSTVKASSIATRQIDPNCQKYQQNSSACEICANRYYFDTTKSICTQVDTSCKTWNSANGYCTSCYSGYLCGSTDRSCKPITLPTSTNANDPSSFKKYCIKSKNGVCTACAYRSFLSSGLCLPVSDLCNNFNPNFGYCLSCYDGYDLINGVCQTSQPALANPDPNCSNYSQNGCQSCNFNYFVNNQGVCQVVSSFCNGYNPSNGFCLDCINPYTLSEQTGQCLYYYP